MTEKVLPVIWREWMLSEIRKQSLELLAETLKERICNVEIKEV